MSEPQESECCQQTRKQERIRNQKILDTICVKSSRQIQEKIDNMANFAQLKVTLKFR